MPSANVAANANQEIRELKQEVQQLAARVSGTIRDEASNGYANLIGLDRREIRRMARRAGKSVRQFLKDANKQAVEMRDAVEEGIEVHPFRSVAAAVAGGILLGVLLNHRR